KQVRGGLGNYRDGLALRAAAAAQQQHGGNYGSLGAHSHATLTPLGATRTGSTVAPSRRIVSPTRSLAPRSTRKNTQPPPPAPHTLAPTAPACRVTATSRSISGVVMPGAFLLRCVHSSRS